MEVKYGGRFDIQIIKDGEKKVKCGFESYPHAFMVNKYFILQVRCLKYLPTFADQI